MLKHLLILLVGLGFFGCEGQLASFGEDGQPVTPGTKTKKPGTDPDPVIDPKTGKPIIITRGAGLRRLNVDEIRNATQDTFLNLMPENDRVSLIQEFAPLLTKDENLGGFSTVGSALSSGSAFTEEYLDILTPRCATISRTSS